MFKIRVLWLLTALLPACKGTTSTSCPTSVLAPALLKEKERVAKLYSMPHEIPGGLLQVSKSGDLVNHYCSAMLTFEGGNMQVWTAQHCTRWSQIENLTFYLFDKDKYVAFDLSSKELENAKVVIKDFPSSSRFHKHISEILDGGNDFSFRKASPGLVGCQDTGVACFTAHDLVMFEAKLADLSSPAQEAMARARVASLKFPLYKTDLWKDYYKGFSNLLLTRKIGAIQEFISNLTKCESNCEEGEKFRKTYLSLDELKKSDFMLRAHSPLSTVHQDHNREYFEYLRHKILAFSLEISPLWKAFDEKKHPLLLATNRLGTESKTVVEYSWFPTPQQPIFTDIGTKAVSSRTFLYPTDKDLLSFSQGDSGTLLTIAGAPVAALSHKDGEETSSSSVLPLPSRKVRLGAGNVPQSGQSAESLPNAPKEEVILTTADCSM